MVCQTGTRVVRSNSCKGPVYPKQGPKKSQRAKPKFWGQQVLFGTKFPKFSPKRANLATLTYINTDHVHSRGGRSHFLKTPTPLLFQNF